LTCLKANMEMENQTIEVRDIWDGDWYWIPRIVFEDYTPKIGVIGLALYNAYSSYARDKAVAFPSQETLAEKLGLSIKTIIKYNRILEANGLIRIERRKGKGKTNLVTLLKVGNMNQFHTHPVAGSVKVVKGVQTKENNMKENKIKENTKVDAKASPIDVIEYFKRRVRSLKALSPKLITVRMGGLPRVGLRSTRSMRLWT